MSLRKLLICFFSGLVGFSFVIWLWKNGDYSTLISQVSNLVFEAALFVLGTMFSVFVFFVTASGKFLDLYSATNNFYMFSARLKHNLALNSLLVLVSGVLQVIHLPEMWETTIKITAAVFFSLSLVSAISTCSIVLMFFTIAAGERVVKRSGVHGIRSSSYNAESDDKAALL